MRTIFSKIRLNIYQIIGLSILVLISAVGEMLLPSLLAQMINKGVASVSERIIFILAAEMAGIAVMACIVNFL